MTWPELTNWWLAEIGGDPAYQQVVTPLVLEVFEPSEGAIYVDIGCGDGRVMRTMEDLGAWVVGVDINPELASLAGGSTVADVPPLPFGTNVADGCYSILTVEHIADVSAFFMETARVTKAGGVLAVVANHPIWTAPDSSPITDSDGETLWRPGTYFSPGSTTIRAGEGEVTFQHRSMSDLLNSAANAGWSLEKMVEQPHHELEDQAGIPRLLACRWRLLP